MAKKGKLVNWHFYFLCAFLCVGVFLSSLWSHYECILFSLDSVHLCRLWVQSDDNIWNKIQSFCFSLVCISPSCTLSLSPFHPLTPSHPSHPHAISSSHPPALAISLPLALSLTLSPSHSNSRLPIFSGQRITLFLEVAGPLISISMFATPRMDMKALEGVELIPCSA